MEDKRSLVDASWVVAKSQGVRRHQLHLWIGSQEYKFLRTQARTDDESMATIVRRLIRQLRISIENNGGNGHNGNKDSARGV